MHVAKRLLSAAAALVLCATPALAQGSGGGKLSLGIVGGLYSLGGDDFTGVKSGFHFEGTARFLVSPQIALAVGGGYNMNTTEASSVNFNVLRVLDQPRYMIRLADPKLAPWIGAQAEWHRYSSKYSGESMNASGFGFGALAGATYWTSPTLGIEASVAFLSIAFGDASIAGTTATGSKLSGTALGLQVGVVFKLGGR